MGRKMSKQIMLASAFLAMINLSACYFKSNSETKSETNEDCSLDFISPSDEDIRNMNIDMLWERKFYYSSCREDSKVIDRIYKELISREDRRAMYFYAMSIYKKCDGEKIKSIRCTSEADKLLMRSAEKGFQDAEVEIDRRGLRILP